MKRTSLVLLAATLLLAACGDTNVTVPSNEGLTGMAVEGVGKVEVTPDTLVAALGVESHAATAPEALQAASESAARMIDAIKDAGVPEAEIKTVSLEVREERPEQVPPVPVGEPLPVEGVASISAPVSFVGEQRIRVRILDLASAGDVIEAAVQAAGEDARVFNMSLGIADPEAAIAQAREAAVKDALEKAESLADAAGINLGDPTSIEEVRSPELPAFELGVAATGDAASAAASAAVAPQIEPGTSDVEVRIHVRFSIER
jgi:uncharacterized protein YggE